MSSKLGGADTLHCRVEMHLEKESEAHSRTLADARSPADPCLLLGLGYTWEYVGAV